jgi:hypothetical protein
MKREDYPVKLVAALAAASALALGGCAVSAERAEEHAQDMAASQCADQGQAFVQTGGEAASNGVVAGATAKGHCADTAEEPPPPPPGP